MNHPTHQKHTPINRMANQFTDIRQRLASALLGQAVDLAVDAKTIVHGTVTGVMTGADVPEIVVNGTIYNYNQILTNVPTALCP
jgi:hypothetical protein